MNTMNRLFFKIFVFVLLCLLAVVPAEASYFPLQSGGNVGIGTTAPGALLHVGTGGTLNNVGTGDVYIQNDLEVDGTIYGNGAGITGISASSAYSDITAPTKNHGINFAGYTNVWTSTLDTGVVFQIDNTDADLAADTVLLRLEYTDDGDANAIFLQARDNNADLKFEIGNEGNVGIGMTALGGKLMVRGAGTTTGVNFQTQNSSATPLITVLDNGNVGIGTTGPSRLFDVNGYIQTDGSSGGYLFGPEGSAGILGNAYNIGTDYLIFNTGFIERMRIIYSGNVGIGTSAPEKLLEVQGAEATDADLVLDADDGDDAADTWFIRSTAADNKLRFLNDTNTRMVITSGGNVGIATTNPGYALDVVGWVNTDTGFSVGGASYMSTNTVGLTNGGEVDFQNLNNSSGAAVRITGGENANSYIALQSTGGVGTSDYIKFQVGNDGATEAMRVISSGNIGIGTSVPGALLHVGSGGTLNNVGTGDAYIQNDLEVDGTIYGNGAGITGITASSAYSSITAPTKNHGINFAGYTNVWTSTLDTGVVFKIDNTDADLAADTTLLELEFTDDGDPNGIFLRAKDNNGTTRFEIGQDGAILAGGATGSYAFYEFFGGNVVLQNTYGFKILDNAANAIDALSLSSSNNLFISGSTVSGSNFYQVPNATGVHLFYTGSSGGTEKVRINNAGNVGIGTSAPSTQLDVHGSNATDGILVNLNNTNGAAVGSWIHMLGGGGSDWDVGQDGVGFGFFSGSNRRLTIQTGGNVGIGTSAPGALLHVGSGGTLNNVGTGDVYIQNDLEVDGTIYGNGAGITGLSASNIAYSGITAPTKIHGINFAGYTNTWTSTLDTGVVFLIDNTDADLAADTVLMRLEYTDDGDANAIFLQARDNNADLKFEVGNEGNVGIGMTALGGKLMVRGAGTTTGRNFQTQNSSGTPLVTMLDNGNVGIGTTGPTTVLNVVGSSAADLMIIRNTNASGYSSLDILSDTGSDVTTFGYGNSSASANVGSAYIWTASGIDLNFNLNNSISTPQVTFKASGNVGIGVTDPGGSLGIGNTGGNANLSLRRVDTTIVSGDSLGAIDFMGDDAAVNQIGARISAVAKAAWSGSSGDHAAQLQFYTQDSGATNELTSPRMVINEGGNVGIGTSAPAAVLDVQGNVGTMTAIKTNDVLRLGASFTTNYILSMGPMPNANGSGVQSANLSDSSGYDLLLNPFGGNIGIGKTTSSSVLLHVGSAGTLNNVGTGDAYIQNDLEVDGTIYGNGAGITGITASSAYSSITAPTKNHGINFAGFTNVWTSTLDTGVAFYIDNTDADLAADTVLLRLEYTDDGDANAIFLQARDNNADLKFEVGNEGNVGIGMTALGGKLMVRGAGTTTGRNFQTQNSSGTPLVTMLDNGNVGIGSVSPAAPLIVLKDGLDEGTNFMMVGAFSNASDNSGVFLGYDSTETTGIVAPNSNGVSPAHLAFRSYSGSAYVERMRVTGGGNIGIGTSTPEELLEVQGAEGIDAELALDADDGDDAADTWFIRSTASSNDLAFLNHTTTNVTFKSGGNVGIGMSAPVVLLHVGSGGTLTSVGAGDVYIQNDLEVDGTLYAGGLSLAIDGLSDAYTDYATDDNIIMGRTSAAALASGAQYNLFIGENAGATTVNSTATTDANIAIGVDSLAALTSGQDNTAIGAGTLNANSSGSSNIAIGGVASTASALQNNTTGDENTAVGAGGVLGSNVANSKSTAIGFAAMQFANDTATGIDTHNTAVGYTALRGSGTAANNTGTNNTAIGSSVLDDTTSGSHNTGVGYLALSSLTTGNFNDAVGDGVLYQLTTGSENVAMGGNAAKSALNDNSTGNKNTAIGSGALGSNVDNDESTAVGYYAMYYADDTATGAVTANTAVGAYALQGSATAANNTGTYNTVVGHSALAANTSGSANTAVGATALNANTSGENNTALGKFALKVATTSDNTAVGSNALSSTTTGADNTGVGSDALSANVTGNKNTAMGYQSLYANVDKQESTAIGYWAMRYADSGAAAVTYNTALGAYALRGSATPANNTGTNNTAVGHSTLSGNTAGAENTALGDRALQNSTTADGNTALGKSALNSNDSADFNTAVGAYALYAANGAGTNNTAVGYQAGNSITTGTGNILIGYDVDTPTTTTSNYMSLGNLVFGVGIGATGAEVSTGNVGIGTSGPSSLVHVKSSGSYPTLNIETDGTAAGGTLKLTSSLGSYQLYVQSADLRFWDSADRVTFKSGGNVGIGFTNPAVLLHVGTGGTLTNVGTGDAYIQNDLEVDGTIYGNGAGITGLSAGGWTDDGTVVRLSTATDNVGIGTTNPGTYDLNVNGTTYIASGLDIGGTAGGILNAAVNQGASSGFHGVAEFGRNDGAYNGISIGYLADGSTDIAPSIISTGATDADLVFGTESSTVPYERMRISSTGNVGIGSSAPQKLLHLQSVSGDGILIETTGGGTEPNIQLANPVRWWEISNDGGDDKFKITDATGPNTRFVIDNTGNIGIGTTAPGSKLQVNNTITFASEYDEGSEGGAFTVNWNNGNKQKVTLTGSTSHTATFTAPTSGVGNFLLKVVQGDASNTISWPGSVKWPASTAPTLTTTSGAIDIVSCYYDGTNYFCTGSLAFGP